MHSGLEKEQTNVNIIRPQRYIFVTNVNVGRSVANELSDGLELVT